MVARYVAFAESNAALAPANWARSKPPSNTGSETEGPSDAAFGYMRGRGLSAPMIAHLDAAGEARLLIRQRGRHI